MAWHKRPYPSDRGYPGSEKVVSLSVRLTVEDSILLERIVQTCDYGRSEAMRRGLHCLAEAVWTRKDYVAQMKDVRRAADRKRGG